MTLKTNNIDNRIDLTAYRAEALTAKARSKAHAIANTVDAVDNKLNILAAKAGDRVQKAVLRIGTRAQSVANRAGAAVVRVATRTAQIVTGRLRRGST